ncbi:hypothetical protein BJV82DRAFT_296854 [Fennellomyces sp. T-0311]|nr:hypothetical protein BJV82DRAFT_296854 [Fennellomyces sp. T-0311]
MLKLGGRQHIQPLVANGDAYSQLTLTHLSDVGTVSNTFAQGKQNYANKNYDEAVKSFNRAIEILEQDLSIVLLHRAATLEMKHDYEGVIEDSSRVNPDSKSAVPDPYVTAAHALLLQNRLPEAAAHLRAGIAAVPTTCIQHQTLVHLNNRVVTEMDARNQWMMKLLPTEILDRILSLLPTKTHINLASTCRFWNSFMLRDWPGMWSTIDATTDDDLPEHDSMLQRVLEALPPSKVRRVKLSMNFMVFSGRSVALLTIMQRQRWNKIEYLGIRDPHKFDICNLLQLTKSSLQTLELWSTDNSTDAEETLINAQEICPNITSIARHIQGRQKLHQILPQLDPSKLVLTRLKIFDSSQHLNYARREDASLLQTLGHTIGSINDQYPSLQELVIDSLSRDIF